MKNNKIKLLVTELPKTTEECPFAKKHMSYYGRIENICCLKNEICKGAYLDCIMLEPVIMPKEFYKDGDNREEAYKNFVEFEEGFPKEDQLNLSFEEFCAELDKGYGTSEMFQIARLYEKADGSIWYDTEYSG